MLFMEGNKISFEYESQNTRLLNEISFTINNQSKIGLIGKNGAGKTTLFKLILGQIDDYSGVIKNHGEIRVGYLPQELIIDEELRGIDYLWQSRHKLFEIKSRIESVDMGLEENLGLYSDFEERGGYLFEAEVEKKIAELDLPIHLLEQKISLYSGGEKTKLAMASVLLSGVDLILLDEPTNHLDLSTLKWLEAYLFTSNFPFVIISHDREFLDKCVNEIWEIKDSSLTTYSGNYSFYKEEIEREYETMVMKYERQQKKIKQLTKASEQRRVDANRMENFKIRRDVKKNGALCKKDEGAGSGQVNPLKKMRSAKALEKRVDLMIEKEKAELPKLEKKRKLHFEVQSSNRSKLALSTNALSKSYAYQLFSNLNLDVETGSRMAIVGKNGSGKSTLLKILMGLENSDDGDFYFPPATTISYFAQEYENLDLRSKILDEIIGDDKSKETLARTVLGSLGLQKDKVFQEIRTLSSGERSKVALAKAVLSGANVLILDEPTNHLEICAREAIEKALVGFSGTIIFVSHDRRFIDKVATTVFDLEKMEQFENYSYYINSL